MNEKQNNNLNNQEFNDFNDRLELYDQINGEGIYDPNRFPLDLD